MKAVLGIAALALAAGSATAQIGFFSGTTIGAPTWNRPVSLSGLSGVGTATPFAVVPFYVSAAGTYLAETSYVGFDGYLLVYGGSFSAATPLVGLMDGDDDFTGPFVFIGGSGSGLDASMIASGEASNYTAGAGLSLVPSTQYYAVVTGFGNSDTGDFRGAVGSTSGAGGVTIGLLPAPGALAVLGLGGLVATRRRR
ncbi:MAG: hypothetical protein IT439_08125 [Phycisphaerales bacterium]|nr:hypothetical protein [Phycisphaerales bacterium]